MNKSLKNALTDIKSFSCTVMLAGLMLCGSAFTFAAPFPAQFEARLMSEEDGRLLGGTEQLDHFGDRVEGLGDVNGDGFDDFVISGYSEGSPANNYSFKNYSVLVYGSASTTSLDFDLRSIEEQGAIYIDGAFSVTPAGDINADGFDDWVFRSGSSEYALVAGQAEPYANPLNILESAQDGVTSGVVRIANSEVNDEYPEWQVTAAGDITGDGIDDLVVDEGLFIWTVPGQLDVLTETLDLANYPRHRLPNAYHDISSGFDINADGFNDVLIGMDEAEGYEGQVVVLFGSSGLFPAVIERASLTGQNGFVIESASAMHSFRLGSEAVLTDDVNGDFEADILLSGQDIVYVLYGGRQDWPDYLDLDQMSREGGYTVTVTEDTPNTLAALGDLNDDGLADWVVDINGELQVVYGVAGARENLVLESIESGQGFLLANTLVTDDFGTVANRIGDVNGDGIDDILFGDESGFSLYEHVPGMTWEDVDELAERSGMAYLVFGRADDDSPLSPSNLQAALGPNLIELRWQAPTGEVGEYEVLRNGEALSRFSAETTFFVDEAVAGGAAYRYEVVSITAGLSSSSVGLDVVNAAARYPSIGGSVYSLALAEVFWAYENVEYTIYRDNVAVDTRWASSYLDSDYSSGGHSYHVAVVPDPFSSITVRSRELRLPQDMGSQPPSTPENLEFAVYSNTTLELIWSRSEGGQEPLQYSVLRDGELVGTTSGNSLIDSGLTGNEYFIHYEVFATDSIGNQSEPVRIDANINLAQQARKPAQAIYYSTEFPSSNSVRLTWELDEPGTPPSGFEIRRGGVLLSTVSEASFTDNSLAENQRYIFEVTSVNDAGIRSEPTAVVVVTPGGPFAPSEVTAAVYGPTLVEVFWSRAEGAERVWSYDLYRDGEFILNTRSLSYLDTRVQPGNTYTYTLVSVAADSRSTATTPVEAVVASEAYWSTL